MEASDSQQGTESQPLNVPAVACPEPSEPAAVDTEYPLVPRLTEGLEECDWDQLQDRYADAMDEHSRVEENLRAETAKLLEVVVLGMPLCNAALTSGFLDFYSMVSNHHLAR